MTLNEGMKKASEAYPGGLDKVWDFEKECAKVGLVDDYTSVLIVRAVRAAFESQDKIYEPELLSSTSLSEAAHDITKVAAVFLREVHP